MSKTKRNITIAAVLLCLCAAVYLNWSYNNRTADEVMADAELASAKSQEEMTLGNEADALVSDYFAQARLTRQQSRDEAISLLEAAATSATASQETIDSAISTIAVMANYSMLETQIENLLLAKNFAECVAFISAEGVTLAVPAPADGLLAEEVARITDAIIGETDFNATQIKIIEVKSGQVALQDVGAIGDIDETLTGGVYNEEEIYQSGNILE
ncbi:MAG: SpoIIIAH-like family protein [Clostridiales bacterium]|nr:SpoIIIAH-like family protein [Clostridiales bacterium]